MSLKNTNGVICHKSKKKKMWEFFQQNMMNHITSLNKICSYTKALQREEL